MARKVRLTVEAVLSKDIVRRLKNFVLPGAELIGELTGAICKEVSERRKSKTSHVLGDVVVVGAPNLSSEGESVSALEPAQRVIENTRGVPAALRFPSRTSKTERIPGVEERQPNGRRRASRHSDVELRRVQQCIGREGQVDAIESQAHRIGQRRAKGMILADRH